MAKGRPCKWCGGSHRSKRKAKECYDRKNPNYWTKKELGR